MSEPPFGAHAYIFHTAGPNTEDLHEIVSPASSESRRAEVLQAAEVPNDTFRAASRGQPPPVRRSRMCKNLCAVRGPLNLLKIVEDPIARATGHTAALFLRKVVLGVVIATAAEAFIVGLRIRLGVIDHIIKVLFVARALASA